jgi:hypothetical protein
MNGDTKTVAPLNMILQDINGEIYRHDNHNSNSARITSNR